MVVPALKRTHTVLRINVMKHFYDGFETGSFSTMSPYKRLNTSRVLLIFFRLLSL